MTRTELKQRAKQILLDSIASAYYVIADGGYASDDLTEEEKEQVYELIRKYGTAMAKSIGGTYYTF